MKLAIRILTAVATAGVFLACCPTHASVVLTLEQFKFAGAVTEGGLIFEYDRSLAPQNFPELPPETQIVIHSLPTGGADPAVMLTLDDLTALPLEPGQGFEFSYSVGLDAGQPNLGFTHTALGADLFSFGGGSTVTMNATGAPSGSPFSLDVSGASSVTDVITLGGGDRTLRVSKTINPWPEPGAQPGPIASATGLFLASDPSNPAGSSNNPFLPPPASGEAWEFAPTPVVVGEQNWFDPPVAIGYDYVVTDGPLVASVELPAVGDDIFSLFVWNGLDWILLTDSLLAGSTFDFSAPVDRFRVLGIETSAALDPDDTSAFKTALTFAESGLVSLTQMPITVEVPGPSPIALIGLGALAMLGRGRRVYPSPCTHLS